MNQGIVIRNVNYAYKRTGNEFFPVLDDISLEVKEGDFVSVVGYSGCGKTTLLKIIGGLLRPVSGDVTINKYPPLVSLKRHRLGFIFQESSLLPWRNVFNNIKLAPEITGVNNNKEKLDSVVDLFGLKKYANFYPSELSGGMKARVAIALAFAIEPCVLLMDEPFGHLDEITRMSMNEILMDICFHKKTTAVFVTHNISEAVFLSDRVLVLSRLPASVKGIVRVDLPRPRKKDIRFSTVFSNKVKEVQDLLLSLNGKD
ncbi:MAG: ABC transporter ATP-binding protein [Candidatus Omnitrophica bacterium]|nr:ABC transporter ATP-binding protein [Candidatus Omnitrophota bacterium]MBU1869954.1 ABC transporter ATP-binding protein [Candidatus Omnitrophota bacterium]